MKQGKKIIIAVVVVIFALIMLLFGFRNKDNEKEKITNTVVSEADKPKTNEEFMSFAQKRLEELGLNKYVDIIKQETIKTQEIKDSEDKVIGEKEYKKDDVVVLKYMLEKGFIKAMEISNEKDGDLNGKSVTILANGGVEEFSYIKGVKNGEATTYYPNGDKEVINYKKGIEAGKAIYYFASGDVEEANYIDGVAQGPAVYKYADGAIEKYSYKDGKLEGKATYRYPNGKRETYYYKDGKRQ